ncbi:MAG: hypothetical protein ACO3A4_11280 [Silvanigrellaceae bacterium]
MFSGKMKYFSNESASSGSLTGDLLGSTEVTEPSTSDGLKIKTLPPSVVKDIEQKNIARRLAGLSPIVIKVRRCIACGAPFESAGNRTCGCSSRTAGTIAGREII